MSPPSLATEEYQVVYRPDEIVRGTAEWSLDREADWLEVRLFWYTEGRGDRDTEIVARHRVEAPAERGSCMFALPMPDQPYSYHGRYVSICWALEVVAHRHRDAARVDLTLSPDGLEMAL